MILVRWPAAEPTRARLRDDGVPRVLLVDPSSPPPVVTDELEDWIREPADDADLAARIDAVERRARSRSTRPTLDDDGVLRLAGTLVALPPVEARLTRVLLDRAGTVVSRDALGRAGWPDGAPGRNALDVHVLRLRRRIAPLGLAIRTVRSRGYLLQQDGGG